MGKSISTDEIKKIIDKVLNTPYNNLENDDVNSSDKVWLEQLVSAIQRIKKTSGNSNSKQVVSYPEETDVCQVMQDYYAQTLTCESASTFIIQLQQYPETIKYVENFFKTSFGPISSEITETMQDFDEISISKKIAEEFPIVKEVHEDSQLEDSQSRSRKFINVIKEHLLPTFAYLGAVGLLAAVALTYFTNFDKNSTSLSEKLNIASTLLEQNIAISENTLQFTGNYRANITFALSSRATDNPVDDLELQVSREKIYSGQGNLVDYRRLIDAATFNMNFDL